MIHTGYQLKFCYSLLAEVVRQTLRDICSAKYKADADRFLQSEQFDAFMEWLDLDPNRARTKIAQGNIDFDLVMSRKVYRKANTTKYTPTNPLEGRPSC